MGEAACGAILAATSSHATIRRDGAEGARRSTTLCHKHLPQLSPHRLPQQVPYCHTTPFTSPSPLTPPLLSPLQVPLDRCRPPPFRPPPRPPSSSRGAPITPAEWAALPSHIRAAFAHDEVETPSWARGAASCRPASFLTPL